MHYFFLPSAVLIAASALPAAPPQATDALRQEERARLVERLHRLDMDHTDWTLLQDVGEKTKAVGPKAVPVVAAEIEAVADRDDRRYQLRLMGVLARLDGPRGTAMLGETIASDDERLAAVAARILGRCGAPAEDVAKVVAARLRDETRSGVVDSLVLGAGDSGATELAKWLREAIENGRPQGGSRQWFAVALAQLAGKDMQAEAPAWLRPDSPLLAAGVLMVRRSRDPKAEKPLLELLPKRTAPGFSDWLVAALGACGSEPTRVALRSALAAAAKDAAAHEAATGEHEIETEPDPRRLA